MTTARVEVVEGPDAGRCADVALGQKLVVGRGMEADLRLTDAQVSRKHCLLEHSIGGLKVVDQRSRTGTRVELDDGRAVDAPALIAGRGRVCVGATVLSIVRRRDDGPAPPVVPGVELLQVLGEGGSGTVWEGRLADGAAVAVKVLLPDADAVARARFEREAGLATRLEHPAIARILGLVTAHDGRPCLLRALVRGRSLRERLELTGALPWREVAGVGLTIAGALAHAHARGVVHRDVKPGNIILEDPGGAPRLIDFDLARRVAASLGGAAARATVAHLTATGEGLGSLAYVAPEQLYDAREADGRADVYGLGLTLYHAASGVAPFQDVEPDDFLDALTTRGPRPLSALARELPRPLLEAVARAHATRPDDRFAGAADLGRALAACLER